MTSREVREIERGFAIESDTLPIINEDESEIQSQNGKELNSVTSILQFSGCFAKCVHSFNPFDS